MSRCRIVLHAVPVERYANAPLQAHVVCEIHGMQGTYVVNDMCPLGRVEQAVEDGVARILAAGHTAQLSTLEADMTDYSGKAHDGSLGAHRVRESFNPSADSVVDKIKRQTADLIDLCEDLRDKDAGPVGDAEQNRLIAIAQTRYEEAAMWAVKAATTPK